MTESRTMSVTTVTTIRRRKHFSSCTAWKAAKTLLPALEPTCGPQHSQRHISQRSSRGPLPGQVRPLAAVLIGHHICHLHINTDSAHKK